MQQVKEEQNEDWAKVKEHHLCQHSSVGHTVFTDAPAVTKETVHINSQNKIKKTYEPINQQESRSK